ncbi:MAG: PD-(D/E)XK nuclease family protein [Desulfuromonadaceae bacterium]
MMEKSKEISLRVPNIFNYATSELSQDAFICWLLQWASSEFKDIDPKLNECGTKFIDALFLRAGKSKPEHIDSIEIKKQIENIDVLVLIKEASGDTHAIIIEDKTDTKHHSKQLERYYGIVRDKFKIAVQNIIPIYLKTGDQSSYSAIKECGFFEFLRNDFLYLLQEGKAAGVNNAIFADFLSFLEKREHAVNKFKNEPINVWAKKNNRAWSGFYIELKKEISSGNWNYVANQTGGFMGFWWAGKKVGNVTLYLLLAENQLYFKIGVKEGKPKTERNEWHNRICKAAKEHQPSLQINKPDRFGSGKDMTVAVLKSEYLVPDSNGLLNLSETIKVLKECEAILEAAISSFVEPTVQ